MFEKFSSFGGALLAQALGVKKSKQGNDLASVSSNSTTLSSPPSQNHSQG
jgi:hypothetical protein